MRKMPLADISTFSYHLTVTIRTKISLEKGDYVNIEHITIGYNIPMKSKAVKSLRLSAGISNLATITGYSGLTPMINSYVVSNTLGIDDKRTYPLYRTYSLGLSIQF